MKIHALDLHFQGFDRATAAYLVEGPSGWVLVETGPMSTLSTLHEQLRKHGLDPADIRDVLVTHIHLDHAGAAGWWAQQGATVYVHHIGAPHLIDPERLWHSARRIYGDDMERLWGQMVPAPADRVVLLRDGDRVPAAGLTFTAVETPGHAWHHHLYQVGNVGFTGDSAGVRMAPDDWLSLPAPPPEFNLQVWLETIRRIEALQLDALYLTHFGKAGDASRHLRRFAGLLSSASDFIRQQMEAGAERDEIVEAYRQWNHERALQANLASGDYEGRYEAANPLSMSVDGIMRYWRKRNEQHDG